MGSCRVVEGEGESDGGGVRQLPSSLRGGGGGLGGGSPRKGGRGHELVVAKWMRTRERARVTSRNFAMSGILRCARHFFCDVLFVQIFRHRTAREEWKSGRT